MSNSIYKWQGLTFPCLGHEKKMSWFWSEKKKKNDEDKQFFFFEIEK